MGLFADMMDELGAKDAMIAKLRKQVRDRRAQAARRARRKRGQHRVMIDVYDADLFRWPRRLRA